MTTVISLGVVSLIIAMLSYTNVITLRNTEQRVTWKRIARDAANWRNIAIGAPAVLILGPAGFVMYTISPAWLQWSWWNAIGGSGNIVFGSATATETSAFAILPVVCLVLFTCAVPIMAYNEERDFRRAAPGAAWYGAIFRSVVFGLVHAIMGAPLIVCLTTLAAGGLLYELIHYRAYTTMRDKLLAEEDDYDPASKQELVAALRWFSGEWHRTNRHLNPNFFIDNTRGWQHAQALHEILSTEAKIASAAVHTVWNWTVIAVITTGTIILTIA